MAQSLNPYFYYYGGEKHYLDFNPDYAFIEMNDQSVAKNNTLLRTSILPQNETVEGSGKIWMDVSGLNPGNYILNVIKDNAIVLSQTVIVKK